MMIVLLVAVGAAVGAPLRYLVDRAVQARHDLHGQPDGPGGWAALETHLDLHHRESPAV